jgi:peroxiredoxin
MAPIEIFPRHQMVYDGMKRMQPGDGQSGGVDSSPLDGPQLIGAMAMTGLRKRRKTGHLFFMIIIMLSGVLLFFHEWGYLADGTTTPAMPMAGQTVVAPDFSLRDLDGNVRPLASFRGRVVLLSFWATWCTPCRTEMPTLDALFQSYKDHDFEVVAVASDVQGIEAVQPFVTQLHLSFTTLLDSTGQVTRLYGVTSLPTTYLLDREGRLVTVAIGSHDWANANAHALIMSLFDAVQQLPVPHAPEAIREMSSPAAQKIAGGLTETTGTREWR